MLGAGGASFGSMRASLSGEFGLGIEEEWAGEMGFCVGCTIGAWSQSCVPSTGRYSPLKKSRSHG